MSPGPNSVRIDLVNATGVTLYAKAGTFHTGHQLSPATATLQPDGETVFSAFANLLDCSGALEVYFNKDHTGDHFVIPYEGQPQKLAPVTTSAPANYAVGIESLAASDAGSSMRVTLYKGLLANAANRRYVIDLGSNPQQLASKFPYVYADFVNGMFDALVRTTDAIDGAVAAMPAQGRGVAGTVYYADYSGMQISRIVSKLAGYWLHGTVFNTADDALIDFLKSYFNYATPRQVLWLPRLSLVEANPGGAAVFMLEGYDKIALSNAQGWLAEGVTTFLTLLVSGAHIVSICADADLRPDSHYSFGRDIYHQLVNSNLSRGNDLGNSHYKSAINLGGWYYLAIDGETMPDKVEYLDGGKSCDAGLINAFLACPTIATPGPIVAAEANYFIQLEGWQQQDILGGERHMFDFTTSGDTGWNISTFGASPYSEKRATSVFLAPPSWVPAPTAITCMMPYVGAYGVTQKDDSVAPQSWLRPELVVLPDTHDALLPRYTIPA